MRLISSIIAASVVDLPEPVGPVTSTRPRGRSGELVQAVGQPELLERADLVRDQAERGADGVALEEHVDAEARDAGDGVRDVDLPLDLEPLLLLGREDPVEQLAGVVGGQRRRDPRAAGSRPCTRTAGEAPTLRWRSEAPHSSMLPSSSSIE